MSCKVENTVNYKLIEKWTEIIFTHPKYDGAKFAVKVNRNYTSHILNVYLERIGEKIEKDERLNKSIESYIEAVNAPCSEGFEINHPFYISLDEAQHHNSILPDIESMLIIRKEIK